MLNYFWEKIPGFHATNKPRPISGHDPNVFHPAAICRGPIDHTTDLGLVDEFMTVSAFARQPVKITMTGPHLLAAVAYDEYYNDLPRMMQDLGKLLHENFRRLTEAGCKHIQIDEPYFTVADDDEVRAAVDAINTAIEDVPDDVHVLVHICQGNYAVGPDYDGQIGHRYFDIGRYKADIVTTIECDGFLVEHDMAHHYQGLLGNRQLGVGAVDDQGTRMAGAGADDHHKLLRLQPSAETCGAREASGHAGCPDHTPRNDQVVGGNGRGTAQLRRRGSDTSPDRGATPSR
jgi:5-methyltetrahydropteroyltriglutamate--homocysteine methyltransferase